MSLYCPLQLNLMCTLLQLGVFLDKRVLPFVLPVLCFILLYSKLPHKVTHRWSVASWTSYFILKISSSFTWQELRFIISSVPMFNLSAAIAANRMYDLIFIFLKPLARLQIFSLQNVITRESAFVLIFFQFHLLTF